MYNNNNFALEINIFIYNKYLYQYFYKCKKMLCKIRHFILCVSLQLVLGTSGTH